MSAKLVDREMLEAYEKRSGFHGLGKFFENLGKIQVIDRIDPPGKISTPTTAKEITRGNISSTLSQKKILIQSGCNHDSQ